MPVNGFSTPSDTGINYTVVGGSNAPLTFGYSTNGGTPQLGALSVTLLPSQVITGTNRAQWRLQGESGTNWYDSDSVVSSLPSGAHIAEFSDVSGTQYEAPTPIQVSVPFNTTNYYTATYVLVEPGPGTTPTPLPSFSSISNGLSSGFPPVGYPYAFNGQILS